MSVWDFLGQGLLFPLRREGSDFVNGGGEASVKSAVELVLGVRRAASAGQGGELPWRQDFGSRLNLLRFRNLDDATRSLAEFYVKEALRKWEPRVVVTGLDLSANIEKNELVLHLQYRLITGDTPDNRVFEPDQEAVVII